MIARWHTARRRALLSGLLALGAGGCTQLDATRARFLEPRYVVTRHFYDEAPQRVALLPFATRSGKPADDRKAESCRRVFYQHMCLRDFGDVELRQCNRSLIQPAQTNRESTVRLLLNAIRQLDVVGMTTFIDLESLFSSETIDRSQFNGAIRQLATNTQADAYVLGITRDFGRLYAVAASSVGISTRTELRSIATGRLLWRGEWEKRSIHTILTLNPLGIPRLLYDVWEHSRGRALDSLAYDVYGEMCHRIPYLPAQSPVYVQARRPDAPYYRKPGLLFAFAQGRTKAGDLFEFQLEQNGWYRCKGPDGLPVWLFRRHARLAGADGHPLAPYADLEW